MLITFPSAIFKSELLWKIFQLRIDNRWDSVREPRRRNATLAARICNRMLSESFGQTFSLYK